MDPSNRAKGPGDYQLKAGISTGVLDLQGLSIKGRYFGLGISPGKVESGLLFTSRKPNSRKVP